MASVVVDSYNVDGEYASGACNGQTIVASTSQIAQNFIASASYEMVSVKLGLSKAGATGTPGTVTAELFAIDSGTGKPTGSALATGTTDGNALGTSTSVTWPEITWVTPYTVTSGTEYTIVLSCAGASAVSVLGWWYDYAADPTQEEGWTSADSGTSWTVRNSAYGFWFATYTSVINPSDKKYTRYVATFCNDKVFYGTDPDDLAELTAADGDIDCTKPLSACGAYGQVFVANHDSFRVADFKNSKIATASIGSNLPYHGDIVAGGSSGAQMVVDFITASSSACVLYGNRITTATFTSGETVTGTNKNGDAVSFTMTAVAEVAAPHWYTWTPYGNDTTNFGSMPTYSGIVRLHIGKLWLTADTSLPHQWYATRQNDPWDFLYAQNDAGSAVAGNNTDAGEVGDIVVDAISYSDDYMVFGCASEMHVMLGNPCAGGRIDLLRNTGLLAARAWTWDDDGNLYMLSTEGILVVPKGFGQADNLTKTNYPDFVSDLAYNPSTHRVTLAYDRKNKGIFVTRVVISTGVSKSWFLDLRSGGFFPESYPEECATFCTLDFDADDPADSYLLAGCKDGYIRKWDHTSKSDDAGSAGDEAIDAYIGFGPMATSDSARKSNRISGIDIVAGGDGDGGVGDSDNLYCKVYVDANAQKVISDMVSGASPRYTKTHKSPGQRKGNVDRRKVFGRWVGLVIGNDTVDQSFAFEHMNLNGI